MAECSSIEKRLNGSPDITSIVMGMASNDVRARFNDMARNHGSVAKAVQELLSRQYDRKISHASMGIGEKYREWVLQIPANEDYLTIQAVLEDLDEFVMGNDLKDRSSGIEDLLMRNVDCHGFGHNSSILSEKYGQTSNSGHLEKNQSPGKTVVVVDTSDDSRNSVCTFCQKYFLSLHDLEQHFCKQHGGVLSVPETVRHLESICCPLCDKLLESKTLLQDHCRQDHLRHVSFTADGNLKLSSNELTKCPQCDYVALRKGRMSTHLRKVHHITEDIKCRICGKSFNSHRAMLHHFHQLHTMINSACDTCGKVCKNRAAYQNHILAHNRTFECRFCAKTFNDRRCYTQHEKRHSSTTVHLCNYCGQQFNMKSNLERHIRITHLKEGKLSCDSCPFSTFYKDNLKEHINKVHFGLKTGKFTCHHCKKDFSRRMVYEEHMDKHDGRYRYSCQFCEKKFRNRSRCKQHIFQCSVGKGTLGADGTHSSTETSTMCIADDVTDVLPDPTNLGLIVTMDFVRGTGTE